MRLCCLEVIIPLDVGDTFVWQHRHWHPGLVPVEVVPVEHQPPVSSPLKAALLGKVRRHQEQSPLHWQYAFVVSVASVSNLHPNQKVRYPLTLR